MRVAAEQWKPLPGYEGLYEVSDFGNVRSLRRKTASGWRGGKTLNPSPDKIGRLEVRLHKDGKGKTRRVHQLVMETFAGAPEPGQEVRHLDGNPANNRWTPGITEDEVRAAGGNLFYGTHAQNMADMAEHGTTNRRITRCPKNHEYTPENTIVYASGSRACRECARVTRREWARANYVPKDPMITCAHCGETFERPFEQRNRKYCTDKCRKASEKARRALRAA